MKYFTTVFLLLSLMCTNASSAILKFKNGIKGKVTIIDSSAVYDTLNCTIKMVGKDAVVTEVSKKDIEYLVIESDTLRAEKLYCTVLSRDDIFMGMLRNDTCFDAYNRGKDAASDYAGTGWFFGGFTSGVTLGLIGTAIISGVAIGSYPTPPNDVDSLELTCFKNGYQKVARGKAAGNALGGGIVGTLIAVAVLFILISN